MDISLIATGAMTLLQPFLTKAVEKAGETIGERLTNQTLEGNLWQKIRNLFTAQGKESELLQIENKPLANTNDIALIEEAISESMRTHSKFTNEIQSIFNLSPTNLFIAEQLLKSIQADRIQLAELYEGRRLAGIETEGSYENMITKTLRRMEKDEKKFGELVRGK